MSDSFIVKPARRTREIKYAVRDIILIADEAKRAGKEMLYLNIGDPDQFDFDVPLHLIEAVEHAMRNRKNGYGASEGDKEALDAIRREAGRKGIRQVQDVFTANGASEAIELALCALADIGDNVILPCPGYPLYSALNSKLNIESRFYRLDESDHWQPDPEDIEDKIDERTRAIVLINPNNPTGSLYSSQVLERILEIARRRRLVVFSDEIYDKILFDGNEHVATASLAEDVPVITFGGISKCYLAPGWRVGWAVISGPSAALKDYTEAIHKMTRARLCPNHPMQAAVQPALDGGHSHLEEAIRKLQRRRDITHSKLNEIPGISCVKPLGAFYAFPKIEFDVKDQAFVESLIRETGVVVVPGSGFGEPAGAGHFRIVFLPGERILEKAYDHLAAFARRFGARV